MIDAIAAVYMFAMFAIWSRKDLPNTSMKIAFLMIGLALAFQSLKQFGFIVSV